MPVDDIKATQMVAAYGGQNNTPSNRKKKKPSRGADTDRAEDDFIDDEASFLGIPPQELTPCVSHAIEQLMSEIDELRTEATHSRAFENLMSDSMDHHKDLPVLTRHALVRELTITLGAMEKSIHDACFIYLQISNLPMIKDHHGLIAADSVLLQTAEILEQYMRETDHIGTLGGDGFGVIMALSDKTQTRSKMEAISARLCELPILFNFENIAIEPIFGIAKLDNAMDARQVLMKADEDLRQYKFGERVP